MIRTTKSGEQIIEIDNDEARDILRNANLPNESNYLHQLGLSSQQALGRIRELPDGFLDNLKNKVLIDKDLLKEIRDAFDNEAANGNAYCKERLDKLDNLYPFLNQ